MAREKLDLTSVLLIGGGLLLANKVLGVVDGDPTEGPKPINPPAPSTDGVPTLTVLQLKAMADILFDVLAAYATEDEALAISTILRCRNDKDLEWLIYYFGNRFVLRRLGYFTLPQLIAEYLEPSDIEQLNAGLSRLGISYTF